MKSIKRMLAVFLSVSICVVSMPMSRADEKVTPSPPPWFPAEDYIVFEGDEVYEPENWKIVQELRADAAAGNLEPKEGPLYEFAHKKVGSDEKSPGTTYEYALACMQYAKNSGERFRYSNAKSHLYRTCNNDNINVDENTYNLIKLWEIRMYIAGNSGGRYDALREGRSVDRVLKGITLDDFFNAPFMDVVPAEERVALAMAIDEYRSRIELWLDGERLDTSYTEATLESEMIEKDGRTMLPIRRIAELLGAEVTWDEATQTITMKRARDIVKMTLGSKTAYLNDRSMEMDVAPFTVNDRTVVPARYVAEFFGQKVTWIEEERRVDIREDFEIAGETNVQQWGVAMGAVLAYMNSRRAAFSSHDSIDTFGRNRAFQFRRSSMDNVVFTATDARKLLNEDGWGIDSREDLISTIASMTEHGHNDSFKEAAKYVSSLSTTEYQKLLDDSGEVERYMWANTKALHNKWGDRGILAWDLFRMSNLAQWGYEAGFVTYSEALALVTPAAEKVSEEFSSWEEAYENYLDGYNWWARIDLEGQSVWDTLRGKIYVAITKRYPDILDDSLFDSSVKPVTGVTFDSLVSEVMQSNAS